MCDGSKLGLVLVLLFLADDNYYKSSDVIRCKDGSGKFTKAQLNDDMCDCVDGTNEPGFYFNYEMFNY